MLAINYNKIGKCFTRLYFFKRLRFSTAYVLKNIVHLKVLILNACLTIAHLIPHKSPSKNKMIKT